MASFVHINTSVPNGAKMYSSIQVLRDHIGVLESLSGLVNEAIGKSQADMQAVFGTNTPEEAQALADRVGAFIAAFNDMSNAEMAKLRDLLNATIPS